MSKSKSIILTLILSLASSPSIAKQETSPSRLRSAATSVGRRASATLDDALGAMSSSVYSVFNGKCEEGDTQALRSSLEKATNSLCPKALNETGAQSFGSVGQVVGTIEEHAEDQFFSLLASQQANELKCAAEFAKKTAAGEADLLARTTIKIKALREAKLKLKVAAESLEANTLIATKACPVSVSELSARNPNFALCGEIIRSRAAVEVITKSIYLSGTPSVAEYIDRYTGATSEQIPALEKHLSQDLVRSYRAAESDLRAEAERMERTVRETGGSGFNRGAKRDLLLSDPAVVERVVKAGGDTVEMKGLACRANARHGHGAQVLDATLMVGSLGLSLGTGLALKAGAVGSRAVTATTAARAAGQISLNSTMVLQATVIGIDSVSAYSTLMNACATSTRSSVVAHAVSNEGKCVSAPQVDNIERDSCVLTSSLSALGFGAVAFPSLARLKDLRRREQSPVQSTFVQSPSTQPPSGQAETTRLTSGPEVSNQPRRTALPESSNVTEAPIALDVESEDLVAPKRVASRTPNPEAALSEPKVNASLPVARTSAEVMRDFERISMKERNQLRGVIGAGNDEIADYQIMDRYLKLRDHTGGLIQYDLQDIVIRGDDNDKKSLYAILKRSLDQGESLDDTRQRIAEFLGEVKLRYLDRNITEAKNPNQVKTLTLLAFENDIPGSRRALKLVANGGSELRENLYAALKAGKRDEVFTLLSEYNPNDKSAIARARLQAREMRREVTEATRRPRVNLDVSARRQVDEARKSELLSSKGFATTRASTADVIEVRERFPAVHEKIDREYARLRTLELHPQVSRPEDIPFDLKLQKRVPEVDPEIQKTMLATWNRMNDPEALASYSRALAEDAAVEMMKKGTERDLQALSRGELNRSAVMSVLVRRHRAQGRGDFSTLTSFEEGGKPATRTRKTDSNQDFRDAIAQGPFFDRPFNGARHGIDSHFLQMDYVAPVVWNSTEREPAKFWNFLGSKKGINYWVPLFDGPKDGTLSRPEFLSHQLSPLLRITD